MGVWDSKGLEKSKWEKKVKWRDIKTHPTRVHTSSQTKKSFAASLGRGRHKRRIASGNTIKQQWPLLLKLSPISLLAGCDAT